jgi:hypothetical protein
MIDTGGVRRRLLGVAGEMSSLLKFAAMHWGAAALIVLFASASLVELSGPNAFSGMSSAGAKGNKGNKDKGDGKDNGNGNGKGGGGGKNGGGGGKDDPDDNGNKDTAPVGDDLQDEGFTPLRADIDVPAALDAMRHGRGDGDKWGGKDSDSGDHKQKNWREDLGLGQEHDLRNLGKDLDAETKALGKLFDIGDPKKDLRNFEDARDSRPFEMHGKGDETGGKGLEAFGKADTNPGRIELPQQSDVSSFKLGEPRTKSQETAPDGATGGDKEAAKQAVQEQVQEINAAAKVDIQTLKADSKEEIQGLKEAGKDGSKEDKQAAKEEIKAVKAEAKDAIREVKAERKDDREAAKDAVLSATPAAAAAASDKNASPAEVSILAAKPGTYAPRQVLALNLSSDAAARAKKLGFGVEASGPEEIQGSLKTLTTPDGMDALQAVALLRRELPAEHFHLNRLYHPYYQANKDETDKGQRTEPAAGAGKCVGDRCYSKTVIRWKDNFSRCARDVRVGIIDTDIDLGHPTFAGQRITQKSFFSEGRQSSANWHGTGVLAILAGRADSGTPGLIPDASFFAASIFFAGDDGEPVTDTVTLLKSLDWMRASGVKLVNMSFSGPKDDLVRERIKAMRALGFVFTAAAGNEGPAALPAYPAAYPDVIAVTAVTKDLHVYSSANRGSQIDLAAPGVGIWTAMPNAREGYRTGTSFAAPFATAVLALQRLDVPRLPKDELLSRVKTVSLGPVGRDPIYGRGLLQAPSDCPAPADAVSALPK